MKVQVVSFHCVLKNRFGQILSSTFNREVLSCSQMQGQKLEALAKALENIQPGEKRKINLKAPEAYGYYDLNLVITVPRSNLPQIKRKGSKPQSMVLNFEGRNHVFRVTHVTHETVTLDANHPLAGQDLSFEVEATFVREATQDEIANSDINDLGLVFH